MNFNKVILGGYLTRDPALKYLPSNTAVCEFGLAVNHKRKDRDGNAKDEVCFVDCSAFGKTGETINRYLVKGKPILIEGRLKFDQWTDREGDKRSKLSVVVESFAFVGDGSRGDGQGPRPAGGADQRRTTPATAGGVHRGAAPDAGDGPESEPF